MHEGVQRAKNQNTPDQVSRLVLGCAMRVHSNLGPGLLENTYEVCLEHELKKSGLQVERQVYLPIVYDGVKIDSAYRLDLVVEGCVIIEIKSVEAIIDVYKAQLISYLKLSGKSLGLIINFNVPHLRNGIRRMVVGEGWRSVPSGHQEPNSIE
ncbi:MAG: GxxExxY protein [Acidobacteriaceae bacterium]